MNIITRRYLYSIILLGFILYACSSSNDVPCKQGINLIPMYGYTPKCKEQLEADKSFLSLSDKEEPDRKLAAIRILDSGWRFLHEGDYNTSMKRMNQAWLLDSTNIAIYASFAVVLDLTQKTDEALKMLDLTFEKNNLRSNPESSNSVSPSNEIFIEFVINNATFIYERTNNPTMGKYLYGKIDSLNLSEEEKSALKLILKSKIPNIEPDNN